MRFWILISLLICTRVRSFSSAAFAKVGDEDIHKTNSKYSISDMAIYVVNQLKQISGSGIYESLEISRILSSDIQMGIYHAKYQFRLELESPLFASGREEEEFDIILMEDYKGQRSFAINEFPEMNSPAIEDYRQQKVGDLLERRKQLFQHIRSLPVAV